MNVNVFVKKVDAQRRITLPKGWSSREVVVEQFDDSLKIVPRTKNALKILFDSVDIGSSPAGFEKLRHEAYARRLGK